MKTSSRIIAFITASLLILTAVGCQKDQDTSNTTNSTQQATQKPAQSTTLSTSTVSKDIEKYIPIKDKVYKINWLSGQAQPVENTAPLVQYWNKKFNVVLNIINADANALKIKIAAGDIPDNINVGGYDNYIKYINDGVVAELKPELLKVMAPKLYAGHEKEFPGYWKDLQVDGKTYGIGAINPWSAYRQPVIWRGDWLENIGITKAPSTFEEVESALYKFAKNDPDKNGKDDTYGLSVTGLDVIYSAFGYFASPKSIFWHERDGKVVPGMTQPEVKEALKFMNKLYKDKVLDPEFVTGENQGGYWALTQPFINGRIGLSSMAMFYHWKPGSKEKNYTDGGSNWDAIYKVNNNAALKLMLAEPIKNKQGKQIMPAVGGKYTFNYSTISKLVADKEPDKVGKILEIWDYVNATDADTLATAIFGIKGEQWNYEGTNKVPTRVTGRTPQDDIKIGGNTLMFSQPLISIYRVAYPENFICGDTFGFKVGKLDNAIMMPLQNESKYSAELDKKKTEAFYAIITGEKPADYFDEFVKDWMKSGGEQIVKEAQEQYIKFKK